jgi:AcrR family transcriptional regulator
VTVPEFERARSAEAKTIRQAAILEAASSLAAKHGVRSVTLTDIAAGVGMHKSTMLRYFETREEIFLHLAAEHWQDWSADAREQLAQLRNTAAALSARERAARVAGILAETLAARPLFCDLLAHAPLNLERGVSFPSVRSFKLVAVTEARSVSEALRTVLPLTETQAGNAVATATALAGALWQMAAPGTELRRFYETDPELAHAVVDVGPRLMDIMTALLQGYLPMTAGKA